MKRVLGNIYVMCTHKPFVKDTIRHESGKLRTPPTNGLLLNLFFDSNSAQFIGFVGIYLDITAKVLNYNCGSSN